MKRNFDFGYIDFENRGEAKNKVTVEMEYKEESGKKRFSVSAMVWNARHSDILTGGQCLDTIAPYIKSPLFSEILRLWKAYHLNDMHPECEHQHAEGWHKLESKKVTLYHWRMTREAMKKTGRSERNRLICIESGRNIHANRRTSIVCWIVLFSYDMDANTARRIGAVLRAEKPALCWGQGTHRNKGARLVKRKRTP